jgi:hypothetical protein
MQALDAARTWRSAKRSAVRQHGEGSLADRAAAVAMKRLFKWLAKHRAPGHSLLRNGESE